MTLVELAQKLRPYIEKAALSLSDADALEAIDLFGSWQVDKAYVVDDKVKYGGGYMKNFGGSFSGFKSMADCLRKSIN